MPVKSEIDSRPQKPSYPYIGVSKLGNIVLFHEKKSGIVLKKTSSYEVGHYSDAWLEDEFEVYHGTVTLSND